MTVGSSVVGNPRDERSVITGSSDNVRRNPRRNENATDRYVNEFGQWESDDNVIHCLNCGIKFSFLVRRHHCRCCGRIYCSSCCSKFAWYDKSRVKVVLKSASDYEMEPYRTCDSCYENLLQMKLLRTAWGETLLPKPGQNRSFTGSSSEINSIRSSSMRQFEFMKTQNVVETVREAESERNSPRRIHPVADEDYARCPICNFDLQVFGTEEAAQQEHVAACIRQAEIAQQQHSIVGSPTYQNRMLVYQIPQNSTNIQECPICFEDMLPGQKVGRLECLCVFHYHCIKSWFKKKVQKLSTLNPRAEDTVSMLGKNYCPFHDAVYY